jgi:dienelactone hydrolase
MVSVLIVLLILTVATIPSFAQPAAKPGPGTQPSPGMMTEYFRQQAHKALADRRAAYEKIKTPEQVLAYQQQLRSTLLAALGEFPEKTPLNAKVTGRLPGDGYRIEKVIFESRPGLFVTGLLYLPDTKPPYPAALVPCGHSRNGKAYEAYQRAPILLARNGIAAFCFDPIGQGERSQVLDESGRPMQGATIEHTLIGIGSILLGRNIAADLVWDGIRAIDYLQSRPDIDGSRIGCTGTSGGGTQTSYLMAIEPRVTCAVPCCYLTSFGRLIDTIGPQDAEQNLHGQIARGLDHADYAILFAPRPVLLGTATRDFFDIEGSWDSFRQAKRIYTRLGFPERVEIVEADLPHNFATELRVPMVRWMRRWLCNEYEPVNEADAAVRSDAELNCTPKGQVIWLEGARSAYEVNADLEARLEKARREFWQKTPRKQALQNVRNIVGVRPLAELPAPAFEKLDSQRRDGCTVTRVLLRPEPDIVLPGLLFDPDAVAGDACLYLDGDGAEAAASPGGPVDSLARRGNVILAVDLPGSGQTRGKAEGGKWGEYFGANANEFFLGYLLGRSYLAIRIEAVLACGRFLANHAQGRFAGRVRLVGIGEAGPAALHAAALEPDLFASLRLQRSLARWSDVVRVPISRNQLINAVHGALRIYDLPDLVGTLPPDKTQVLEPVDPAGEPAK